MQKLNLNLNIKLKVWKSSDDIQEFEMKKYVLLFALFLILTSGCGVIRKARVTKEISIKAVPEISRELRGVWVTRFNWTHEDPEVMKTRIVNIMEQAAGANFNAVFFQVRGQAETLYPSPIETWSKLVGEKDPGFDPVAMAVKEAHRHGLNFHAYINLLTLWNEETPPGDPNHLYYKHGPKVAPDSSWVCFEQNGEPMSLNEYYYLNPALPDVKSYLKSVIRHFVETYDIEGLHFDRIRYPGANYLWDPYSIEQFRADSLMSPISRGEWARRKLTDLVEDVVVEALLIKPYLHISAATWGLYRTDDLKGYEDFNSGYHHYYQDAINWLDRGIMDFIVPMIYWDIDDPKPNFNELWADFKTRTPNFQHIFPGMRVRANWIYNGEIARQVNSVRRNSGMGHVMFSLSSMQRSNELDMIKNFIYPHKVELPKNLKRVHPDRVVALKLVRYNQSPLAGENVRIEPFSLRKTTDSQGWVGLILPKKTGSVEIRTTDYSFRIGTRDWNPPYRYVVQSDGSVHREKPWVEFRRLPADTTTQPVFHVLCKTDYPGSTFINGDSTKIYKTGIFFNKLTFREGVNRVRARVIAPDSSYALYEREVYYKKVTTTREPFPLWIDSGSVEPAANHILPAEDNIRISFIGSRGQQAFAQIRPTKIKIPLSRKDFSDYSLYQGDLSLQSIKKGKDHHITLILESTSPKHRGKKLKLPITSTIHVQEPERFPLVKINKPNSIMTYNLGEIRLGGPIIAEYETGVILQVCGQVGDYYRIYLNRNETGFIHKDNVEVLQKEHVKPSYYIQSVSIFPAENADIVHIPYPESVPYAVYPEPDQNRIKISLYGVKTTSTWITHRDGLKMIKKVTWQQVTPETYQLIIQLKTPKIWGYKLVPNGSSLEFRLKYPPQLPGDNPDMPLKGLKVAIEAGHGGRNLGAVGLSGLHEKAVNLDVARELENICREHGIEVLQVRYNDTDMLLSEKLEKVETSDADLLVSIHANAGGGRDGYLGVSGTSTYYNNPFWAEFAEIMYKNLLELPLKEFGVVGSFNYSVIRMTSRPAILVEQAFLSHAEDEEKLAFVEFRRQMAQKIYEGIVDYVSYMLDNPVKQ